MLNSGLVNSIVWDWRARILSPRVEKRQAVADWESPRLRMFQDFFKTLIDPSPDGTDRLLRGGCQPLPLFLSPIAESFLVLFGEFRRGMHRRVGRERHHAILDFIADLAQLPFLPIIRQLG